MGSSTSTPRRPHQDRSRSNQDGPICKICQAIISQDFTFPLRVPLTPSYGTAGAVIAPSLGTRREISRRNCKLCFSFFGLTDVLPTANKKPDEHLELRAFPFSLSWPIYAHAFGQHQIAKGHLPDACLFVCRKGSPPTNYDVRKALEAWITTNGLAVLTLKATGQTMPTPSRPQRFSVDKTKLWIQGCLQDHGILCGDGSSRVAVRGMKVIDCETLAIKPTTANMRWVALSYVWRLAVDNIPIGSISAPDPNSLPLPAMIPALIVDAMTVVQGLGYRYLWVDRYCINQDDKDEVRDQIAQMDRIYRGADFTIIAAGESNGLAGVSENTVRPPLQVFNFNATTTLYETDPNPIAEIRRSSWFTRGWTFQEAILSRRRLFLTDSQALFECATSTRCEMGDLGNKTQHTASHLTSFSLEALVYPEIPRLTQLLGSASGVNLPPDLRNEVTPLDEYLEEAMALLMLYRSKKLTVQSDTLDAFSGVLKVFEETPYGIHHLQGIPYPRHHTGSGVDLVGLQQQAFALGLTWVGQGSRRAGFPSWTWAGWDTSRSTGLMPVGKWLGRFEGNFTSYIRILGIGCRCGQTNLPLSEVATIAGHKHETLAIKGRSIPSELLTLRKHGDGSSYLEVQGPEGLLYTTESRFPSNMGPEELLAGIAGSTLIGIALGEEGTPLTRSLYVLVVEAAGYVDGKVRGERKDLVLLIRSKDFLKEEPFFHETVGLQTIELVLS